jgi:hypothetical protein
MMDVEGIRECVGLARSRGKDAKEAGRSFLRLALAVN